jgi:hypothetical protein
MTTPAPDDELLDVLGALLRRADPTPDEVRRAASASLAWRDPDAALAVLIAEQRPATVRGPAPRLLTFEVGDMSLDLEVTAEARRVRLVGQLVPPGPTVVTVHHADGTSEVPADALGRFVVTGVATGLVRVCCTPYGATHLCTEWFQT